MGTKQRSSNYYIFDIKCFEHETYRISLLTWRATEAVAVAPASASCVPRLRRSEALQHNELRVHYVGYTFQLDCADSWTARAGALHTRICLMLARFQHTAYATGSKCTTLFKHRKCRSVHGMAHLCLVMVVLIFRTLPLLPRLLRTNEIKRCEEQRCAIYSPSQCRS